MADDNTGALSPEHAAYLKSQAVDIDLALSLGVRSLLRREDNPQEGVWENWANHPAILYPWTSPDGRTNYQVRPDHPTEDQRTGKPRKYVFAKDAPPVLWPVRVVPGSERILIIEGTKQCLAGASYAPPGVSVYGIAGCRSWQYKNQPIPDLAVVDGCEVVIILDADAAENPQVFEAGTELAATLVMEGATKVGFTRLPGGKDKSGLDDILAARSVERRNLYLARLISGARPKPADAKPKLKRKSTPETGDGRVTIICNRDRRTVIDDLCNALLTKWDGVELFNHGGVISRRKGDGMHPVDKGSFHDLVQDTAVTVNENDGANGVTYSFTWPDSGTMMSTMSKAEMFSTLDRISHAPFVRHDGTVVTEPGYDEVTRTILIPDDVFEGIKVPEDPSPAEIAAARDLILTEWLGDFPFESDADRANVLGLAVTPAIRGMVPKVPLAVIDGLQMGVGKNLLADSILTAYTGQAAQPMNWVPEAEELRKQITSAFRTGAEFFVFDEAHTVEGTALAQALTAETWQDRILGVSTMAYFPNRVTWISLGNQVQVKGDLARRVYRIALRPDYANPQDRRAETFRHPGQSGLDLLSWTRKHRKELMTAILTLVRAWFAADSPVPARGISFGSFEAWERITGGIVETAGLDAFLGNLTVWRSESDFDTQYWTGHLGWLRETFGGNPFRTAEVREKALTDPAGYLAPPRLDDPSDKGYGKALGEAYSRLRGRRYGRQWMERAGFAHGHVTLWTVHDDTELPPAPGTEPEPPWDPDPAPQNEHGEARGPDDADLTGDSDEVRPSGDSDEIVVYEGPADPDATAVIIGAERGHGGYCIGGVCFEDDFTDECDCWCHKGEATTCQGDVYGNRGARVDNEVSDPDTQTADNPVDEDSCTADCSTADVVTFDLETGDADDLYRTPGDSYIRIGATANDGQKVLVWTKLIPESVTGMIRTGGTITGHNIMAFDLPALVRAGAIIMPEIHRMAAEGRVLDGLLAARFMDPPMAKDTGVDHERKYDLGNLGVRYGLGEKLTEVSKPLAKKYGGWAHIPIDVNDPDPERAADAGAFIGYMVQDVELSRRLHGKLIDHLGGSMPAYLKREHRVAAIAAQISANGFLVDQELLAQRVAEIQERKAESIGWLAGHAGVALTDSRGTPYKSPLASKAGKQAIVDALVAAGVPEKSIWRTEKAKDPQISADSMRHYAQEYAHSRRIREICKNVYRIVSARTVYETIGNSMMPDGRVHPKIGFEQATGRWSVTKPGLTVMGKRGGRHVERAVLLPDPGEVLISADLSQVDMRAVAGLSQDQAYIEMLKTDDPHTELAVALFGDVKYREAAKAIGHGWNYGESLRRISESNEIEPAIVNRFDQSMRDRFGRLVEWRDEIRAMAESGALLDNGFGRLMRPDPQRAWTQGPALMGQGAARDLMMEGMLRLPAEILPMLRAQIHDEIVLSVPADRVEEIGRTVVEALSFEWRGVPILADVSKPGTDWSICYSKD